MKEGKITESILERSVLKLIDASDESVIQGAGAGRDISVLGMDKLQAGKLAVATNTVTGPLWNLGRRGVYRAANNFFLYGITPLGYEINLTLPAKLREQKLKNIMTDIQTAVKETKGEIIGGHTMCVEGLPFPILSVTVIGKADGAFEKEEKSTDKTGAIVMTKWAGTEGGALIAKVREEALLKRYSKDYLEKVNDFGEFLSIAKECRIARAQHATYLHDIGEGGVFGALWELSDKTGCGFEVDLKKILLRQEIVEVCNFTDVNPYKLTSVGSLLCVSKEGEKLVETLKEAGIEAAIIGELKDSNDKIIRNEDEIRYLDSPKNDEFFKIYHL
ncbi:MAG: hydrogenase maturation factor [Lachnospiraceae bacterium]|nr:hydrogenase maturation factor [Lachnospiraceae bacterium]